ncbi:DUF2812 domain-containing protein [Streptococcus sp. zg-86]|uniref:DUF2812 domain-containing protein n=1 Tax=Streptococcus zhangguiae TaxID=2664091 RepID=A0A6I4REP7_9STRE|nr:MULTISPECIES: DUF2812 domain-containing protein [unclassified Streptococcus]MTB64395.1 DUF2812 domain-containing protein [Streptococcus sp. zg-86]MTB90705.1 DUF2812 domain-containing protein [Streptococcus sp. zg-36]MWV56300.1 DUF2812 domain-containing protein [Streptococcus sp. zg-70]QTH47483.1 DUF2812 domain-containing protein [Streptococcus sp. zg-86]
MKKHKIFVTIPDEEKWINQVQSKGYRLIKVNPYTAAYTFEKVEQLADIPIVRIDYRKFASKQAYFDYLSLFTECGWTLIPGSNRWSYQYFTHVDNNGDTDIFSDDESRNALYQRVRQQVLTFFTIFIANFTIIFQLSSHHQQSVWNLKELYLTPDLWGKSGFDFWLNFLFETPFVLLRSMFPSLIILGGALFYLYMAYKNRPKKQE